MDIATDTATDRAPRVEDHAGVAIGRVDDEGWVTDFGGVRFGRALGDGIVEDFAGVHLGAVVGSLPAARRPVNADVEAGRP